MADDDDYNETFEDDRDERNIFSGIEEEETTAPKRRINQNHGFMRQILHIQKGRADYEKQMRKQRKERVQEMWDEKDAEEANSKLEEDRLNAESWLRGRRERGFGRGSSRKGRGSDRDIKPREYQKPPEKRVMTRRAGHYVPKALRRNQQRQDKRNVDERRERRHRDPKKLPERKEEDNDSRKKSTAKNPKQPREKSINNVAKNGTRVRKVVSEPSEKSAKPLEKKELSKERKRKWKVKTNDNGKAIDSGTTADNRKAIDGRDMTDSEETTASGKALDNTKTAGSNKTTDNKAKESRKTTLKELEAEEKVIHADIKKLRERLKIIQKQKAMLNEEGKL